MDYMINYEKDIQTKLDRNEKLLRAKTEQITERQCYKVLELGDRQ